MKIGMTIDDAEKYIIALKHCETCEANNANICKTCPHYRRGSSAKCYDAIDVAIETMQKYEKILKIHERFQKDGNYYHNMAWIDVMKVLEDGGCTLVEIKGNKDGNNNQHN